MSSTSDHISALISVAGPGHVWVPADFDLKDLRQGPGATLFEFSIRN